MDKKTGCYIAKTKGRKEEEKWAINRILLQELEKKMTFIDDNGR